MKLCDIGSTAFPNLNTSLCKRKTLLQIISRVFSISQIYVCLKITALRSLGLCPLAGWLYGHAHQCCDLVVHKVWVSPLTKTQRMQCVFQCISILWPVSQQLLERWNYTEDGTGKELIPQSIWCASLQWGLDIHRTLSNGIITLLTVEIATEYNSLLWLSGSKGVFCLDVGVSEDWAPHCCFKVSE